MSELKGRKALDKCKIEMQSIDDQLFLLDEIEPYLDMHNEELSAYMYSKRISLGLLKSQLKSALAIVSIKLAEKIMRDGGIFDEEPLSPNKMKDLKIKAEQDQ